MQFICVVTASYTLDFLMTKSPELVFWMKQKFSKQIFFGIFIYGKNAYQTISYYGKMPLLIFHSMENMLVMLFS